MDYFKKILVNLKESLPIFTICGSFIAGLGFLNSNKSQLPIEIQAVPFITVIFYILIALGIVVTLAIFEPLSPLLGKGWEVFTKINTFILRVILKFIGNPIRMLVIFLTLAFIILYLTLNDAIKAVNFWLFSLAIIASSVVANRISFSKFSSFLLWATRERIFIDTFREQHNWVLNHWGSHSARFEDRMIFFEGDFDNPQKEDGYLIGISMIF